MTVTKIYVGNLPETCRRSDLQELFEKFGAVEECDVVKNYGFVHMCSESEAKVCIENLHNTEFMGNTITVEASHSKVRPRPGMGGKGQCFRCGRQGHWSKECPRGPSRPPSASSSNGYRTRDPYAALPPQPPSYVYRTERISPRYSTDRMRPYPDPYDRRAVVAPLPPRSSIYDRHSPTHSIPDYIYTARGASPPPAIPRHSVYDTYSYDQAVSYATASRARLYQGWGLDPELEYRIGHPET